MASISTSNAIDLKTFTSFYQHPHVKEMFNSYDRDVLVAQQAIKRLHDDLMKLNNCYYENNERVLFSSLESRAKSRDRFFHKIYRYIKEDLPKRGFTSEHLYEYYQKVYDLAGVRFACPYFDEIEAAIQKQIRPYLVTLGYAVDLSADGLPDKNLMDEGDQLGYRSYHFHVKVPALLDIFGATQLVICEIQGRSELQHVWAQKSHELLYAPGANFIVADDDKEDMKQISNSFRAADHFLVRARDRVRGGQDV